jgi:DNA polymerase-3 subunit delta
LNVSQVNQWIQKRADKLGAILSPVQISKISSTFSNNLWQIDNELNKIIHYKRGISKEISKDEKITIADDDLKTMSSGKIDENIFALTDAIGNKNKNLALALLEKEIEAGMAEIYLLHMVVRQFRILLQVRQALDSGFSQAQITGELKLHPYVVQKSLRQASGFSLEFLKNIFLKLIELDRDLKTGQAEFKVSLELLITKL